MISRKSYSKVGNLGPRAVSEGHTPSQGEEYQRACDDADEVLAKWYDTATFNVGAAAVEDMVKRLLAGIDDLRDEKP